MITAIILTKNEETMIQNCINSVKSVAHEIIVVDNDSTDRSVEIAEQNNARIFRSSERSFAVRRNIGLENATGDWVLYIDADERVTPELSKEIKDITTRSSDINGYILNRDDYYFGSRRPLSSPMHRLFKRQALKTWKGDLHETPQVDGAVGTLTHPLLHFTHTDINSMLTNTLKWSDQEAMLRFNSGHPPVVWWRLVRVFITGFWNSYIAQQGYKCGTAGWIEAIYQGCSMFITYAKLWELQNKDKIINSYRELDKEFEA